ncbi:hypothetical protein ACFVZH_32985 [Streptomyces sp. NPDC059534]|uniref:hypothetical protein n=1 Tax=Streptomyces sp. NPDC059534 TaxID=3346859 RepID=UPI003694E2AE
MHHLHRRDRQPARRAARPPRRAATVTITGADIVLVGYFSAGQRDFQALMDEAATELAARGARVVGQVVQRRGVSRGGARKMSQPLSRRTVLSHGKIHEAAAACAHADADAAVFLWPLTERQRQALTTLLGRPAIGLAEALIAN